MSDNNAFTDHDRLCYLCRQEQRKPSCNKSIRHRKHRYSCALPKGHDGPHAYVRIKVQRFDEGGLKGYLEVESRLTTEDFDTLPALLDRLEAAEREAVTATDRATDAEHELLDLRETLGEELSDLEARAEAAERRAAELEKANAKLAKEAGYVWNR